MRQRSSEWIKRLRIRDFNYRSRSHFFIRVKTNRGRTIDEKQETRRKGKKTLLILNEPNRNIYLSARNLDRTNVTTSANLNTYQIMNAGNILMVESSVKEIENT